MLSARRVVSAAPQSHSFPRCPAPAVVKATRVPGRRTRRRLPVASVRAGQRSCVRSPAPPAGVRHPRSSGRLRSSCAAGRGVRAGECGRPGRRRPRQPARSAEGTRGGAAGAAGGPGWERPLFCVDLGVQGERWREWRVEGMEDPSAPRGEYAGDPQLSSGSLGGNEPAASPHGSAPGRGSAGLGGRPRRERGAARVASLPAGAPTCPCSRSPAEVDRGLARP